LLQSIFTTSHLMSPGIHVVSVYQWHLISIKIRHVLTNITDSPTSNFMKFNWPITNGQMCKLQIGTLLQLPLTAEPKMRHHTGVT
jgi:hypothetical protein